MHLGRARVAQLLDDGTARRAADDGVVHENDALAAHRGGDDVELDLDSVLAHLLIGRDERSADIFVFQKSDAVGNARSLRVAERRIQTRIGNADDDIRVDLIFFRKERARALSRVVHIAAVDLRIGARRVEVLEHAERLLPAAVRGIVLDAVFGDDEHFARLDLAHLVPPNRVERAGLGSDQIAPVVALAEAERAEAVRVARGDELGGRHDDERIRPFELVHRGEHRLFDGTGPDALAGDHVGDDFGIRGRVEDAALVFKLGSQLRRVDEVAVVRKRHVAFEVVDDDGLRVLSSARARRAVAHVPDRHVAEPEFVEYVGRENIVNETDVFIRIEHAVVVDDDARGLLPAVLERKQRIVSRGSDLLRLGRKNAEHAAFFVNFVLHMQVTPLS